MYTHIYKMRKMHLFTSSQTFNANKHGKSNSFANDGTGNIKLECLPQAQGHLRSYSRTRCPLPKTISLPTFIRITIIDFEKIVKCDFSPLKWPPFPKVKVVEVKFADKVPLTISNVLAKFHLNNHDRFGKRCKNVTSDP